MFRSSSVTQQIDMFANTSQLIPENMRKTYNDSSHWHNQFYQLITSKIDETIFKPLFNDKHGSPNAPIRVLVGMLILKEANGLSDSSLFEEAQYNLLTRSSLGLANIDDALPAVSTYYLFRHRLVAYMENQGVDLMQSLFASITNGQCKEFGVKGKQIRMDSKLLGSNIAKLSRYELVHRSLVHFYKTAKQWGCLREREVLALEELQKSKGHQVVFRNTSAEVAVRLSELGNLVAKILESCVSQADSKSYKLLKRIFEEQYLVKDDQKIELRESKTISADSIQSPYDTEASYRCKGEQVVQGVSVNISETCDDNASLNLITDTIVAKATTADNTFFIPAVEASEKVTEEKVKAAYSDGCYNDQTNKIFCEENDIDLHVQAIQGCRRTV